MKYLCLGYYDRDAYQSVDKEDMQDLARRCGPHDEALRKSGRLVSVASLAHGESVTIRPGGGGPTVTDGPFVEGKEVVGSFFIVEASDLNEAVRIASLHPAAQLGEELGWAVEVRPIEHLQEAGARP